MESHSAIQDSLQLTVDRTLEQHCLATKVCGFSMETMTKARDVAQSVRAQSIRTGNCEALDLILETTCPSEQYKKEEKKKLHYI